ncbi:hypothetical protein [Peribacillus simplex]|uniref:hypothetical protein n=1 Tax=Peribacillus simplex TaxID=1478 RepID=UPI00366E651F
MTLKQASSNLASGTSNKITPSFVNDFRNVKKKVKKYEEWSNYKRVSDNLTTGKAGGSISSTKSVTFNTSVTGSIYGLGISTGASKTSTVGYTLNVGANKRVYMGYKVRYSVEEGENHKVDIVTGKTISKSKYKVKKPKYGEYKLISVN